MPAFRHILAATDLSPAALPAVDRALQLAQAGGAPCTVVHALGLDALAPLRPWLADSAGDDLAAQAERELRALLAGRPGGTAAGVRVERGLAGSAVLAAADAVAADLVVIGARGSGMAAHLLLASTAHRLLRQSRRPVLVARQGTPAPYRRAVVAVDFSPASALCLAAAARVAPEASLLLLHVLEIPPASLLADAGLAADDIRRYRAEASDRALARLRALAAEGGRPDCQVLVLDGEPAPTLLEQVRLQAGDLVVMGKHGTLVTEEVLLGSTTLRLLAGSSVDALVVVDERDPPAP